jgi:hypothetical protein
VIYDDDIGDALAAMEVARPRRAWPTTAANLNLAMGYGTWASIWLCDEASGDLADSVGGITLADGSTPTYRNTGAFGGDYAVGFDSVADRFEAAGAGTFDIAADGGIAVYICAKSSAAAANATLLGKISADGNDYWLLRCANASGHVSALARSLAGTPAVSTLAANHCDGQWHDILYLLDRTTERVQVVSDLGSSTAVDITDLTTIITFTSFALGQMNAIGVDALAHQAAFVAVATGGIDTLRANATTAIANIRRFTGRG